MNQNILVYVVCRADPPTAGVALYGQSSIDKMRLCISQRLIAEADLLQNRGYFFHHEAALAELFARGRVVRGGIAVDIVKTKCDKAEFHLLLPRLIAYRCANDAFAVLNFIRAGHFERGQQA